MHKNEFTFPSADGKTLIHVSKWLPEKEARAVLQIAHGVSEYIDRYEPLAAFLTEHGFVVVGNDHIGHGKSLSPKSAPAHFDSWDNVVDDMYTLRNMEKKEFPDVPYFLAGHSMGSYLLRTYLIRYPGTLSGAILLGTGQMDPLSIAYCRVIAHREARKVGWEHTSPVVNQLSFDKYNRIFAPNRTDYDWLSSSRKNVDSYISDPGCGGSASVGLCREMLCAMWELQKKKNLRRMNLRTPILFLSGSMDPVGGCGKGVKKAFRSFQRIGMRDVSMKLYLGARHEILNDVCGNAVRRDLLSWMNVRIPKRETKPANV